MSIDKERIRELEVEKRLLRNVVDALCREAAATLHIKERFALDAYACADDQGKRQMRTGFVAAADQLAAARRDLDHALATWADYLKSGAA